MSRLSSHNNCGSGNIPVFFVIFFKVGCELRSDDVHEGFCRHCIHTLQTGLVRWLVSGTTEYIHDMSRYLGRQAATNKCCRQAPQAAEQHPTQRTPLTCTTTCTTERAASAHTPPRLQPFDPPMAAQPSLSIRGEGRKRKGRKKKKTVRRFFQQPKLLGS